MKSKHSNADSAHVYYTGLIRLNSTPPPPPPPPPWLLHPAVYGTGARGDEPQAPVLGDEDSPDPRDNGRADLLLQSGVFLWKQQLEVNAELYSVKNSG
ncbi:hypothetical protein NHX12_023189 [Muraenolepis orangiensis]|uniref:Uncharacterized protein n=1 Tax=Muraenolepis orangiensis TaxID=630683 RepID=A0A9Q0EN78_9TELE|nr:hypothetical protein NHX12_023189 [Muraenolepis orangiensis]